MRPCHVLHRRTSSDVDLAWHLLTVLLRLRRPASPAELSVLCAALASPDLVQSLCSLPSSPLSLDSDGFVTVSASAAAAFARFLFPEFTLSVPPIAVSVSWMGPGRKRKGNALSAVAKRRPMVIGDRDRRVEGEDVLFLSISGSGVEMGAGVEESLLQDRFIIPKEDQALIAFDDCLQKSSNVWNDVVLELEGSYCEKRSGSQDCALGNDLIQELSNLPDENLLQCEFQDMDIQSRAPLEALNGQLLLVSNPGAELDIIEGMLAEYGQSGFGFTRNEIAMQEIFLLDTKNTPQFCSGVEETENDAKYLGSIACCAPDKEKNLENGTVVGMQRPDEEEVLNASITRIHVNADVTRDKEDSVIESTVGPLALQKLDIKKGGCLASSSETKALANSVDHDQNDDEGAKNICKKYVRRKFKIQNSKTLRVEKVGESVPNVAKESVEAKKFPKFESFIVKEEEGSGGYGIVYRAVRKDDGKTFAIKCPHSNAHSFHVNNELKMLERFGGRSFIIRLEGCFKSGKSECFVLEHVEHDRPEILKWEIEVSELQWYGYCLFKALSSLHKQGIVHRDVKPGNFLFSRKVNKGYLIDFNLALDLHHKNRFNNRYESKGDPIQSSLGKKAVLSVEDRQAANSKYPEAVNYGSTELRRSTLPKNVKKGAGQSGLDVFSDFSGRHKGRNQPTADGSGLTSIKDVTSTRTPSAERMREPLPSRGRKELLTLAQEAMQSPPSQKLQQPVSQRKRIPAPLGKAEKLLALLTPMPLHLNGAFVSDSRQLKDIGNGKQKTEGPCVGTKGFRAPEVLFKSLHQGCKIDMWSAGVTLLYMIIGRTPFGGDPEQNIKEIAKLKGSEDLWEVAKIHNRESSFPTELLDVQSLQSVKLRSWCQRNTKKPDFLNRVPDTLFDLVDRCLTVNPRLRISSEEALMHDFFSPCREELRKQRILRISQYSDPGFQK